MTMTRGTQVVLNINPVVALCEGKDLEPGDVARVSSRKKNGWLRVTVQRTGKTISVRNIVGKVTRLLIASRPQWPVVVRSALLDVAIAWEKEQAHLARITELERKTEQQAIWLTKAVSIIKAYQTRYPSRAVVIGTHVTM